MHERRLQIGYRPSSEKYRNVHPAQRCIGSCSELLKLHLLLGCTDGSDLARRIMAKTILGEFQA